METSQRLWQVLFKRSAHYDILLGESALNTLVSPVLHLNDMARPAPSPLSGWWQTFGPNWPMTVSSQKTQAGTQRQPTSLCGWPLQTVGMGAVGMSESVL